MNSFSNTATVRSILGLLASVSTMMLIYASVVPLQYVPLAWDEAVARFRETPWLDLHLERRADWVANALVVIPSGFLAMGAIDWKRRRRSLSMLALPWVVATFALLVVGIEFLQLWFPNRTISQNDIAAGIVGAVIGPVLWMLFGRTIGLWCERFMALPRGGARIVYVIAAYGVGLMIYSAMPFDLVVRSAEWREKIASGRVTIIPFSDLQWSLASCLSMTLVALRMVPIGFAAGLSLSRRSAFWLVAMTACCLELIQLPVYSRYSSTSDVLFGFVGGAIGYGLVAWMPLLLRLARSRTLWIAATGVWSGLIVVAFVGRYERLATPNEIRERFDGLWVPPLLRYYYTSEFSAGSNLAGKLIVFAMLGFLLSGCIQAPGGCRMHRLCVGMAVLWTIILGAMVEILQVFLLPFIPDASDVGIYSTGALCGAVVYQLLFRETTGEPPTALKSRLAPKLDGI